MWMIEIKIDLLQIVSLLILVVHLHHINSAIKYRGQFSFVI
jgi:hypothetical protein